MTYLGKKHSRRKVFISQEELILILQQLGLTANQAKIFFTLSRLGRACTAKTISMESKVAREHVYRILPVLEEMGFVEHLIGNPTLFRAILAKDAVSILLKDRKRETFQLQKKTREFFSKCITNNAETITEDATSQFLLVPKKVASIRKRIDEIDCARKSIDFITSWKRFPFTLYTFTENANKALNRNVHIRVMLEKPPKGESLPEIVGELKKMPNYELRYIQHPPSAIIGIFDKKRVIVKTSSSVGLAEAPSLWSNNPCLLSIVNDFFEFNWMTATETIPETP